MRKLISLCTLELVIAAPVGAQAVTEKGSERDPREGRLPSPGVQYPELKTSAPFVCTNSTCSSPIFKAEEVSGKLN